MWADIIVTFLSTCVWGKGITVQNFNLQAYWTPIFNIFNPFQPVWGAELEPCYVEREGSPLAPLTLALRPDRVSPKVLLTGQMGSGKSSALARLAHTLGEDYVVVWIDLYASMDVWSLSILELLLALGGGMYKVARQAELDLDPRPWQDMVSALATLISETHKRSGYELDAEDLLQYLICARGDPVEPLDLGRPDLPTMRFDLDLGEVEEKRLLVGVVLREMVERVNTIVADIEAKVGLALLVIVDGLDKVPRPLTQGVFEYGSALSEIRCRTVYTLPYDFYKASGFAARDYFDIHELPNVKLHLRGKREDHYEPGFETMRQVVWVRLETLDLKTDQVIDPEALDRLVWGSGGVMRVLIRLVRTAVLEAETRDQTRIDLPVAEHALQNDRNARSHLLSPNTERALRDFVHTGELDEEQWLVWLKDGNIVAYEDRGRIWYDIHPNLLPLLQDE